MICRAPPSKRPAGAGGQALVELALVVPFFAVFLSGLVLFGRFFVAKLFLMEVVRQGYLAMVYGNLDGEETERLLRRKYTARLPAGVSGFDVDVDKPEKSLVQWVPAAQFQPTRVRALATLDLGGLSRRILNADGIPLKAELAGLTDTWRKGLPPEARKILTKLLPK